MGALITIRNDGPDDAALMLAGQYRKVIAAGTQCVFSVNCEVSFEPIRRLTASELAEQSGLPPPPDVPMGRFVEDES
jgi:N-acyl-D-aspartate/D-glutamate deacylase